MLMGNCYPHNLIIAWAKMVGSLALRANCASQREAHHPKSKTRKTADASRRLVAPKCDENESAAKAEAVGFSLDAGHPAEAGD